LKALCVLFIDDLGQFSVEKVFIWVLSLLVSRAATHSDSPTFNAPLPGAKRWNLIIPNYPPPHLPLHPLLLSDCPLATTRCLCWKKCGRQW
jgi:hypothetical protein